MFQTTNQISMDCIYFYKSIGYMMYDPIDVSVDCQNFHLQNAAPNFLPWGTIHTVNRRLQIDHARHTFWHLKQKRNVKQKLGNCALGIIHVFYLDMSACSLNFWMYINNRFLLKKVSRVHRTHVFNSKTIYFSRNHGESYSITDLENIAYLRYPAKSFKFC